MEAPQVLATRVPVEQTAFGVGYPYLLVEILAGCEPRRKRRPHRDLTAAI